ncbi:hypothetical protein C1637_09420 [Chryseobacterium lactis]|uniref:MoxR-vWA-beta-propeller ternary system domain-containing protein n=1 Tax=Chryseobacterium lactis TaxID=1241981 RepID=A0A3G6RC62_CHRLC|nr:hypothetical protein [Chryseobacterium lactis]AZA82269.1 hypothetical protein EG342_10285 [Chryseobacterium lactis]AZB02651.1 hypothetical protein EG341_01145 [Chryseobacterium lactis]PNW14057.1 hypothetical protein C1637_09420 [Chryseobacterium lactis]
MAEDPSKYIKEFWAELPRADEDFLGSIRDWKNVQIAVDDETIWLKGFTDEQAVASEIHQLPNFVLYELREGLLFKKDTLVPSKKVRTGLLWTPIDKALRLTFPASNQNYFGISETVQVRLKESTEEQPVVALLSFIADSKESIAGFPKFKLEKIKWTIVGDKALFLGTPLLSLPGKAYWTKDGHLLPAGYDFEFKNLSPFLQRKYNENSDGWLLWDENGNYLSIKHTDFRPLSISSFRLTEKSKEWN